MEFKSIIMRSIIPQNLAIRAFRDSGYKDAAHALAELIDNSIQAGESSNSITHVEVLCMDKQVESKKQTRWQIHEVGVLDNACGMSPEVMSISLQFGNGTRLDSDKHTGMGRFGMGLPNASISQCKRVEVYSWQNSKCFMTYLDVTEVEAEQLQTVPEPVECEIPSKWLECADHKPGKNGTLVVWKNLDNIGWSTSGALLRNSEAVVGRMYRHFINEKKAKIRLAHFEDGPKPLLIKGWYVRVNDPLYLMNDSSSPEPFDHKPAFMEYSVVPVSVDWDGGKHVVNLKFSVTGKDARTLGGSSPIGKHCAKNQGVSIVRAGRELTLSRDFDDRSDTRERWWGVEVSFSPALDSIFGVTNNKQDVTAFDNIRLEEDAEKENMTQTEYRELLKEHDPGKLAIYEIAKKIRETLDESIRPIIKRMAAKDNVDGQSQVDKAADLASKAVIERQEKLGKKGESDSDALNLTDEDKKQKIKESLVGTKAVDSEEEADKIASLIVNFKQKFHFLDAELPGPAFFDVTAEAGTLMVKINSKHPVYDTIISHLNTQRQSEELSAIHLLLGAWARLEDEADGSYRETLQDIRTDWGKIARDFLRKMDE
jgi:hypothetical protein